MTGPQDAVTCGVFPSHFMSSMAFMPLPYCASAAPAEYCFPQAQVQEANLDAPEFQSSPADNVDNASKGPISMLQEFVQSTMHGCNVPLHRPILQWNYQQRMADSAKLEFRATVAFLLDGVPHHAVGDWHFSKKLAQRCAAERALGLFVNGWGQALIGEQHSFTAFDGRNRERLDADNHVMVLEDFCQRSARCEGMLPKWKIHWEGARCKAIAELQLMGVPHHFAGDLHGAEQAARLDTAKRILWYLQCPGYEHAFELDGGAPSMTTREIPTPPSDWTGDCSEDKAQKIADKKTMLMRVQNRLQQAFNKQLKPGQPAWRWTYESSENQEELSSCRAKVYVAVIEQEFTGDWEKDQRDAQISTCLQVEKFLDSYVVAASATATAHKHRQLAAES